MVIVLYIPIIQKGETPLHVAAKRARLDVIQSLVEEHDAEISAITKVRKIRKCD